MYHALNRAVGRNTLFDKVDDYAAFAKVLEEGGQRAGMRLLGFCVMPNHWHLVLWTREDGDWHDGQHADGCREATVKTTPAGVICAPSTCTIAGRANNHSYHMADSIPRGCAHP